MGIIQCAENCEYQLDGYCTLGSCTTVSSVTGSCPYCRRVPARASLNKGRCFGKPFNPDKLNSLGDGSELL